MSKIEWTDDDMVRAFNIGAHNEDCTAEQWLVRYKQRREQATLVDLKAQYALDVETCKTIDGLEAWQLWQWQYFLSANKGEWFNLDKDMKIFHLEYFNRRHPHADNIIAYHKCSERDKKRWQFKHDGMDGWCNCITTEWRESYEYRLKPETITINRKEYAAPLRVAPEIHIEYWYFLNRDYIPRKTEWDAMPQDLGRLAANNCFATEQDCKAVADAFNALLRGDDND